VGDTLWVFSRGNGRLSVYSKDLVLLRSRQLPYRVFSMSPARQGSGLLLSGFFHPAAKTTGWSVARVSMDDRADVFGGHIPDTPDRPMVEMQHAAMTQNGEVWTVAMMGGAIDVLDRHLSVVERLRLPGVPRAEDVRPRVPGRRPRTPPSPRVVGLGAGEQGLLWVPIGVADADWTPDLDDDVDGIRALFDTRVLAIDPATRTVVGETLLDDVCLPAGGSLISCVREGDQVIVIAQLMLVRR
jgi:hypothetical protein